MHIYITIRQEVLTHASWFTFGLCRDSQPLNVNPGLFIPFSTLVGHLRHILFTWFDGGNSTFNTCCIWAVKEISLFPVSSEKVGAFGRESFIHSLIKLFQIFFYIFTMKINTIYYIYIYIFLITLSFWSIMALNILGSALCSASYMY